MTLPHLPDDIEALKDLVMENFQRAESESQRAELYKFQLENLKRQHFGPASEKCADPPGQQLLFELPARPAPCDAEPVSETLVTTHIEPKKHGGGRKPLPKDLPRERIEHTLPESERACSCCGETMQPFGEESSEQLEYIPASFKVIEHARVKYACKRCQEKPAIAPPPDKVIDKGLAGPGLMGLDRREQIRRSPAAVPAGKYLRTPGYRHSAQHAMRLAGPGRPAAPTAASPHGSARESVAQNPHR